MLPVINIK